MKKVIVNNKPALLGFYDYTVVLTYISLVVAVIGISWAFRGETAYALICLMVSGVCDMFDGTIARTKQGRTSEQKNFGIQIDSLCDLVCFGVLPMVIVYENTEHSTLTLGLISMYVICALIRLAYFNVTEEQRSAATGEPRTSYLGLPVTSAALIFPAIMIIHKLTGANSNLLPVAAAIITGLCFILPFQIPKPKLRGKIIMTLVGIAELICMAAII